MRIRDRSLVVMFSQGLGQATALLLYIILVRIISKTVLGTYQEVFLAYAVIMGVLTLQLENSLFYFLPKLGLPMRRTLLMQTMVGTTIMSAVMGGIMFFAAEQIAREMNNPHLVPLLRIAALYPFAERLISIIPAFMISLDRAVRSSVYSLAFSVTRVCVVVLLFAMGCDLPGVIWGALIATAAIAAVGCVDMWRLSKGGPIRLDWGLILQQFHYTWPIWTSTVIGTINVQFDKLLITRFFKPEDYAVYARGAIELPVIGLITASIATAVMPNLVVLADQGKKLDALWLWQEAARKCSLVIFPCFAFFMVIGPDLMVMLWTRGYAMAAWPFAVYLLMLPIRITVYASIFRAIGQTKPIIVGAVLALTTNVVVSTALTYMGRGTLLAYVGPSLGSVASTVAIVIYMLWKLKSIMGVRAGQVMRWKELGHTMGLSIAAGLVALAIQVPLPIPLKIALQAVVFVGLLVPAMLWTGMLKDDEKSLLYLPVRIVRRVLTRRKAPDA